MSAWYNENDPKAAAWLRELIKGGHIADGVVDERSIEDVLPNDLTDFTQCHFFAGIGGWSYALRLAGWPDDTPVWTGSCPCQPFSAAGKGGGFADERHLWPAWYWLVRECRPDTIFGEQVASPAGLGWFDTVQADMEAAAYSCVGFDLCAAGVGAPHIRQRLYWLAHGAEQGRQSRRRISEAGDGGDAPRLESRRLRDAGGLADTGSERRQQDTGSASSDEATDGRTGRKRSESNGNNEPSGHGADNRLEYAESDGRLERRAESSEWRSIGGCGEGQLENSELSESTRLGQHGGERLRQQETEGLAGSGGRGSGWGDADWIHCTDQKYRPVEPGTFPLAHGIPGRVGLLRGYGNAIVPQVAAAFIEAAMHI